MEVALFLIALLFIFPFAGSTTVKDIEGRKLRADIKYHVLPVIRGGGGGLALGSRNRTCPFNVMQENSELSQGLSLIFLPIDDNSKFIRLSYDVNIAFHAATTCIRPTGWMVGTVDSITGRRYVTTGAVPGRPGVETVSHWFKLEKHEMMGYKIVYCPSVCSFCKVVCANVGVFSEDERRWLGLTDDPLLLSFKKV